MKSLIAPLLAVATVLAPVVVGATSARAADDIVDAAVKAGSFTTLVTALKTAGLVETLKGAGPFTDFAPNDDAFAKLPKCTVEDLLKPENKAKLSSILTYHVVSGKGDVEGHCWKDVEVEVGPGRRDFDQRHEGRYGRQADSRRSYDWHINGGA